ncbi:hypothetical protein CXF79_06640 [Colwellia sp. Bg11-28]|nr:hypothetical protein CXF79_06640 [Colwellia sp. Bg11-28]
MLASSKGNLKERTKPVIIGGAVISPLMITGQNTDMIPANEIKTIIIYMRYLDKINKRTDLLLYVLCFMLHWPQHRIFSKRKQ